MGNLESDRINTATNAMIICERFRDFRINRKDTTAQIPATTELVNCPRITHDRMNK